MRHPKGAILLAFLLLMTLSMGSLVAWGEITLHGAEAEWWYYGEHDEVCRDVEVPDYCRDADHWGVELATYFEGDWAYVAFDARSSDDDDGRAISIVDIDDTGLDNLGFFYTMVTPPAIQTNSGPSMAFWLVNRDTGEDVLAISEAAPGDVNDPCQEFDALNADWWYGPVTINATEHEVDIASLDLAGEEPVSEGGSVNFTTMLGEFDDTWMVEAVLVVMGVVGSPVGGSDGVLEVGTGQAVIDNINLTWKDGDYGGMYHMEPAWETVVQFDDWTSGGGGWPEDQPPREWDKWCTDPDICDHCQDVDDENLWGIISESDIAANAPAGAVPFSVPGSDGGSSPYAIYFGVPGPANYDVDEAAVGAVCSPMNELNPGDKYVSLTFDYFREVESYMGTYDQTFVQIWFDDWDENNDPNYPYVDPFAEYPHPNDVVNCGELDLNWKTVWYRDSSDPCSGEWEEAIVQHYCDEDGDQLLGDDNRIIIPPNATRMRIRFVFNSVDGATNDYFGWLIDDIIKEHGKDPAGCLITTEFLPQGEIGEKYGENLGNGEWGVELKPRVVDGNTNGPRDWSVISIHDEDGRRLTDLPGRLALDSSGLLYGTPDVGTQGTYTITFQLDCWNGGSDQATLILNIRSEIGEDPQSLLAYGDFGDDTEGVEDIALGNPCVRYIPDGPGGFAIPGEAELDPPPGNCNLHAGNLWHQTDLVTRALEDQDVQNEYGHVAFFGREDDGDDPDYDCENRDRVKGCMQSPMIAVCENFDGEELIIGFKSWRNVEYFEGQHYDRTWVDYRVEGGDWKGWEETNWRRSSNDPSLAEWTWHEFQTGLYLEEGTKIQIRFCFDSIDGFANGAADETWGWLVDEVTLYAGSASLAITSCPPTTASVNEYYNHEITVTGGGEINPTWEISDDYGNGLPPGLELDNDGRRGFIRGTPRSPAGRYEFEVIVRNDDWTEVATRRCTINVTEDVTLLWEDFEDDPFWSQGGLWHITADAGVNGVDDLGPGNHAAYYGQDDAGGPNYNVDARTNGMLTLVDPASIDLTDVDAIKVFFDFWRQVEPFGGGGYDKAEVQIKLDDGDWTTIWSRDSADESLEEWQEDVLVGHINTEGANSMGLRFVFDSVDKWYNDYVGWLIDNVKVHSATTTGATTLSAQASRLVSPRAEGELSVVNLPNPVTDVHTTTFMIRSVDVEAMRVEIYDLAGTLVFEDEVLGNELVWHTDNDFGEFLANGIYLYRAFALIDGEWIVTKAQKLVILR